MGFVINDNKNNGNIEQMLFESFLSHRWTLSFTARSINLRNFIWSFVCHLEYLLYKVLENMNLFIFQE